MAFLDNSGDIILDVTLTDHGRKQLSRGDGTFHITKFALGDEEIDYSLYNSAHASGSAYYDLEILQTPILEAFTDNQAGCKTKLSSFQDLNLLYLPVLKLNEVYGSTSRHTNTGLTSTDAFLIAVDHDTEGTVDAAESPTGSVGFDSNSTAVNGILFGASFQSDSKIRVDQGIDSSEISPKQISLMNNLREDYYTIQMDNRLGTLASPVNGVSVTPDYVDDDNVAYYSVVLGEGNGIVTRNNDTTRSQTQTITGPRGSVVQFKVAASIELNSSTFLFSKLGSIFLMKNRSGNNNSVRYIDSTIRVTGMKTGYFIDVPVRYIKSITV